MSDWEDSDEDAGQQKAQAALADYLNNGRGSGRGNYARGGRGGARGGPPPPPRGGGARGGRGGNSSNGNWRGAENQSSLTFKIGSCDVGRMIGSGGSRIKELRQASGCKVSKIFLIMNLILFEI